METKRTALGILFALLIVAGVGFTTMIIISPSSGNKSSSTSTDAPIPIQMRVISQSTVWQPGGNYDVIVSAETLPGQEITAATTHLIYDPKMLQVTTIKSGNLWTNTEILTNSVDNEAGEVLYTIVPQAKAQFTDKNTVAVITMSPINSELIFTDIKLGDKSALASPGKDQLTPSFAKPLTITLTK